MTVSDNLFCQHKLFHSSLQSIIITHTQIDNKLRILPSRVVSIPSPYSLPSASHPRPPPFLVSLVASPLILQWYIRITPHGSRLTNLHIGHVVFCWVLIPYTVVFVIVVC